MTLKVIKSCKMIDGKLYLTEPLTQRESLAIGAAIKSGITEALWQIKQEQRARDYQEMLREREAGGYTKSARYIIPGFAVKVVREK